MTYAICRPPHTSVQPGVNIYENPAEVLVEIELPGRKREEIAIELTDRSLKISAPDAPSGREGYECIAQERRRGAFERSFRLGADLLADKIQARFEQGLLLLTLPKREAAKARKVEIL